MTAAVPSEMNHPTDQTLAAFVDETLNAAERQEVMTHMADCAECLEAVMWTAEIKETETPAATIAANVVSPPFGWKRIVPLAAAASLAIVIGLPQVRGPIADRFDRRDVVTAANKLDKRQTEGRLSLDAVHKSFKGRLRGGESAAEAMVEIARHNMEAVAAERATPANLHALGLAYLVEGKRAEAVDALTKATATDPSADYLNDLAAAYLERNEEGDDLRALNAANRAMELERTAAGVWNRALALERLGRDAEAKKTWQEYLQMDPNSKWAEEVRARNLFTD